RPGRVRDRVEHVGVAHGRRAPLVHEVQLDLQAHLRRAGIEHMLMQHPGEDLQRAPHLVPVPAPVFAADLDGLNVTAHEASAQVDREPVYPPGPPPYTLAPHPGLTPASSVPAGLWTAGRNLPYGALILSQTGGWDRHDCPER